MVPDVELFHDVSWLEYERACVGRGDASLPRITYLDGSMELMTPSRDHERIKSHVGALIEAFAVDRGIELGAYGSWTLKAEVKHAGVEPDACYIVGAQQEKSVPDLVIEVVWTSASARKLEAYRRLGVPEVWLWRDGELKVHVRLGDRYVESATSRVLATIDLALLAKCVDRPTLTEAVRSFWKGLG